MPCQTMELVRLFSLMSLFACNLAPATNAQETKRPFTVADEIGLTLFIHQDGTRPQIRFSPDGEYFALWSERGRLDLNRVEDSLRFYRREDVQRFVANPDKSQPPSPIWVVDRSNSVGTIINDWRWLPDSSGVAFSENSGRGGQQLVLADLRNKRIETLTSMPSGIGSFDVRDRSNYVFTASDPVELRQAQQTQEKEREAPATDATGANPYQFLFTGDPSTGETPSTRKCLWAVIGGKQFKVQRDGALIAPEGSLALSPDAASVVTKYRVQEIPSGWETLYPPPYTSSPIRLHANSSALEYVRIDLKTGSVQTLTDAPVGDAAGWWWSWADASWSRDGQQILLPDTFVKSKDNLPSRPCVAVVDIHSRLAECVEILKTRSDNVINGHTEIRRESGFHSISDVHFEGTEVMVDFTTPIGSTGRSEYNRTADGAWQLVREIEGPKVERDGLQVEVEEGLNESPRLVGREGKTSRVIWDPNPQLKDIALGEVSIYTWEDKEGRQWKGGLFKPVGYIPGRRYPMVIQTHGFAEDEFRPSGVFPTAFAARALAANGIMVLQMAAAGPADCMDLRDEGPCEVSMLESGAKKLISDGLADPERIGAIGFSRTCFQVMEELTTGSLHLKAASITDGIMFGYFEYVLSPELIDVESKEVIGPSPFRGGMQQWIKKSPGFNLVKINTPLLIVGEGRASLLGMWEPYSGLHYLKRPVDLVMLNTNEHVLTNPAVRMASQGGSVDWFRFWLQGYEDPDPTKAEQYKRWRELRKMQEENEKKSTTAQAASN